VTELIVSLRRKVRVVLVLLNIEVDVKEMWEIVWNCLCGSG
jgi:hypothetical protein